MIWKVHSGGREAKKYMVGAEEGSFLGNQRVETLLRSWEHELARPVPRERVVPWKRFRCS